LTSNDMHIQDETKLNNIYKAIQNDEKKKDKQ